MALQFGLEKIAAGILSADPLYLLFAVLVFIASGVLGAGQWGILLRFHGIHPGYMGTVTRYFAGLFFNYTLPGFFGGDFVRVYQASQVSGRTTRAVSSTLADRIIGLLVLVLFSLGGFCFLPGESSYRAFAVAVIMFGVLAGFIGFIAYKPAGKLFSRIFGRLMPARLRDMAGAVYNEMNELIRSPSTLATVFITSFFIQLTRIAVHFLCGRAVGIELGFTYFALFVPLMEIGASSLPISIGGVGVRESIAVALFYTVGVAEPSVVAYSLLATLTGFICSMPGGIAFALSRSRSNPL